MAEKFDLVIIGGGSAGLTAAKFASNFGKSALIVERERLGGDCTWTGCVPSKTLLSAANAAHAARSATRFGISVGSVEVDYQAVRKRVADIVEKIYTEDDSPEALKALNIDTASGMARFLDPRTVEITDNAGQSRVVSANAGVIIASGAMPSVPKIDGLESVPYITYEQVFSLEELPTAMTIVGGGPIGCELGQAFSRLGAQVTIVAPKLLPALDAAAGEAMEALLGAEGVRIVRARASSVAADGSTHTLRCLTGEGDGISVTGDCLLVATGRVPRVSGMDLEKIGVSLNSKKGIAVDAQLRTGCAGVYAAGDCTGDQQFTHYAGFQGGVAARNLLLPLKSAGVSAQVPGCTFTSPEVAHIGMTEAAARAEFGDDNVQVIFRRLLSVDRAICTGQNEHGFFQLVLKKDDTIIGATIMAPPAGELISEISLAMHKKMKLSDLIFVMHAYPTFSLPLQVMGSTLYYNKLKKSSKLLSILKKIGL